MRVSNKKAPQADTLRGGARLGLEALSGAAGVLDMSIRHD